MKTKTLLTICTLLLGVVALQAQDKKTQTEPTGSHEASPPPGQIEAIKQVSHWVGEWSGSGWSMTPDRKRQDFDIFERVSLRLGGSVLLVEGKGEMESDDGARETTHESLAILSFDENTSRYNWRTYDLRGNVLDPDFLVDPNSFRWNFRDEESGVHLRFVITVKDNKWHETGEVSPDNGENWYKILEMNLERN